MIDWAASGNAAVRAWLARHPKVTSVREEGPQGVRFACGPWTREVLIGNAGMDQRGLIELMDNNPLVCADGMSVPSPAATAALIAIGPVAAAGIVTERPVFMVNVAAEEPEVDAFVATSGWHEGVTLHAEEDLGSSYLRATAIVSIRTPADLDEIDDLYEERYGRSFFVRRDENSEWGPSLVAGKPYALYRLSITPDEPASLLTIQVLSDTRGKTGAAQVVHAMNVMSGFEESLGLA